MALNEIQILNNDSDARTFPIHKELLSVINATYTLALAEPFSYQVDSMTIKSGGASITGTLLIGSTAVAGCSGVDITSSQTTYAATSANTVASGDSLSIWFSSAMTNGAVSIFCKRT